MTAANYEPFVERMIEQFEGAYGWDAADPGGPTKYGITCYDLAEHRGQQMTSMQAWAPIVKAMTLDEADAIYAKKYATACRFNDLQTGCDCVVFDFGVNSGSSQAVHYAQIVVGTHVDGILGPITLEAINNHDAANFINQLCNRRLEFLRQLRIWDIFGKGWSSRVSDLRTYSLGLIKLKFHPAPPEGYVGKPVLIPLAYAKSYPAIHSKPKGQDP